MIALQENGASVDVGRLIDESPLGRFQFILIAVCFLLSMIEGFDTQAIAFAAPSIAKHWGVAPSSFGPIFSAGLLGAMVGAIGVGIVQDRFGRRRTLIGAVIAFSLLTWLTSVAQDFGQLLAFRVAAGIGLGAAAPTYFSYAAEFAPARLRTTIVALIVAAFPVGAVLGGVIAMPLLKAFGWESLFWFGGAASLAMLPAVWWHLPESIRFLALRRGTGSEILAIFKRLAPLHRLEADTRFFLDETPVPGGTFRALFVRELLPGTILLPLALCSGLLLTFCLLNWLPMLLVQRGFGPAQSVQGAVFFNLGGIVGTIVLTQLIDRTGKPLLIVGLAYIIGAVAIASLGWIGNASSTILTAIFVAGFFTAGPQLSLTAFIANFYPTAVRGTGIGWGQGIGRLGSLVGPLVGGLLLAMDRTTTLLFPVISIAALISAATLLGFMLGFKKAAGRIIGPN